MAGESCSWTLNVPDNKGKIKVSNLWKDLSKFFGKDRREAILHYFLTKDLDFLSEYRDVLKFDEDGEVTIESLKKALDDSGEYSGLDNARTREILNQELSKEYYDYSTALNEVLKFNRSHKFKEGFMADFSKESDGKYKVFIRKRSADAEYALADKVQNKIMTDAIIELLRQKGLSVKFLETASSASVYSTMNLTNDADGLLAVAQLLNGERTSEEAAEIAGHFIVAAMEGNELVDRLVNQLNLETQKALFKRQGSPFYRKSFAVTQHSAVEAAGILVGHQLLSPLRESEKTWSEKLGGTPFKAIKYLLRKIGKFVNKILGGAKPIQIRTMVEEAKAAAANVANGYFENADYIDVEKALTKPSFYEGVSLAKYMQESTRKALDSYYNTLDQLKEIIRELKVFSNRVDRRTNEAVLEKLEELEAQTEDSYASSLRLEGFADGAAIAGVVKMITGITGILDTDIRGILERIQPSDKAEYITHLVDNGKEMRVLSIAIRNIAQMYELMKGVLDRVNADSVRAFEDVAGNMTEESLRNAVEKLGEVLVGNREAYKSKEGKDTITDGLAGVMEYKRKQVFIDFLTQFYGRDYIERNAGKTWKQRKLTFDPNQNRRVEVRELVEVLDEEISLMDRYISSAADCGDFVVSMGYKIARYSNKLANDIAFGFWDNIETLKLQMEDLFGTRDCTQFYETMDIDEEVVDDTGISQTVHKTVKTGNLLSAVNYGAWEYAREKFKKQLVEDFYEYLEEVKNKLREANKYNPNFRFEPTDNQKAVMYHDFIADKWEAWHEENSIEDETVKNGTRWIPNPQKYKSQQWEDMFGIDRPDLSEEEKLLRQRKKGLYNKILELKSKMDSFLPANSTVPVRAPQMVGRFSHRFKNLRAEDRGAMQAYGAALRSKARDMWTVREDEAYLFGTNNEFNELEEDPFRSAIHFEREKLDRLPIYGINKLKNMELLSTDLFGTLLSYGSMAATYYEMSQVVDFFELGRDVLKKRIVKGEEEGVRRKGESRNYARYLKMVEKNIYGLNVTIPSWDRKGIARKLANTITSIGSKILLGGNVHSGMVNTGTGFNEILKEAIAGENFTLGEVTEAHKIYIGNIIGTIGNGLANTQRPDDFHALWIRHWDIRGDNRRFLRGQKYDTSASNLLNNRLWEWYNHSIMLPYSSGDHYMQTIPFYAMGLHEKVYTHDGKEISLMEAYEVVDGKEVFGFEKADSEEALGRTPKKIVLKPEIFRSAADILKYDTAKEMLARINDFNSSHSKLKNAQEIALDFFTPKQIEFLKNEKYNIPTTVKELNSLEVALNKRLGELVYNERDESFFMDKCRNITNRLHGIYNEEDKTCLQQNLYGAIVTAMRGYAFGMINRRYADNRFNPTLGKNVESNYNTYTKLLASLLFDFTSPANWRAVSEAFFLTTLGQPLLFSTKFGNRLKADMMKANWSEHQYYNVRRVSADWLLLETLWLFRFLSSPGFAAGSDNDGEDDDMWSEEAKKKGVSAPIQFFHYMVNRLAREQEAFIWYPGMKFEFKSLLSYIPVGYTGMETLFEALYLCAGTLAYKAIMPDVDPEDAEAMQEVYGNSTFFYQKNKEGQYEKYDEKYKNKFWKLAPYFRSKYVFFDGYAATEGYEWGRMHGK